jgi:hypothetical protein
MKRKAVFSGKFYPEDYKKLKSFIEKYQDDLKVKNSLQKLKKLGLILPHAGYFYSGKTAIKAVEKAYLLIEPRTIVIIGTNHTGIGNAVCSVWDSGEWETPFGSVAVDSEISKKLIENSSLFEVDYSAHLYEHSIEVQLPILQYFFKDFKIVPIVYNVQNIENTLEIIKIFKNLDFTNLLLVASSDLNHYDDDSTTRKKDEILIDRILNKDLKGIYEASIKYNITACGIGPISVLVGLFENIELVYHTTSAEMSNDYSYTVGYASFILR